MGAFGNLSDGFVVWMGIALFSVLGVVGFFGCVLLSAEREWRRDQKRLSEETEKIEKEHQAQKEKELHSATALHAPQPAWMPNTRDSDTHSIQSDNSELNLLDNVRKDTLHFDIC